MMSGEGRNKMLTLPRLGLWSEMGGLWFKWVRLYTKTGKWMPLCNVTWRYTKKPTLEYRLGYLYRLWGCQPKDGRNKDDSDEH